MRFTTARLFIAILIASLTSAIVHAQDKKPTEDPEVEAYIKAQGWKIAPDLRMPEFKRVMALSVIDPKQPFGKVKVTAEGFKMLGKTKTVEFLNLLYVECTDDGLKAIAANQTLTSIVVQGEALTDEGIKALAGAKGLSNVAIVTCDKVTDAGLRELAKLPKLETLKLILLKVNGTCFDAFAECKTLRSLQLTSNEALTDEGAKQIAKLPALTELDMISRSKITSAGIKAIVETRLPPKFEFDKKLIGDDLLETLVAKGWLYGPAALGRSDRLPEKPEEVRSVSLSGSAVTDKGFESLLKCSYVNSLFLDSSGITDATLLKMGGYKQLKTLSLKNCKVTAIGLAALSTTPMEWLNVEECVLTEESFQAIGKMTKLKQLW